MKLEKFDYQIGNKKAKREFIALGVLCLFLVITVVLYKTFANFSSTSSYNIISGRVAPFNESRKAIITKDISATNNDKVNAILYDDGTLAITGEGNAKDFVGNDLLALVIDDYVSSKVVFTEEEQTFIDNNKKMMNSLFDIVIRPWNFEIKDEKINEYLTTTFTTTTETETVVDEASVNMAKEILSKVKDSGLYMERLEINDKVSSLGANTFALIAATNESEDRDKDVYLYFHDGVDYAGNNNMPVLFNIVVLNASLNEVKSHGVSDIAATGIELSSDLTKIPNDIFAYYNDANASLTIPDGVKSIGINAFYSFNGVSLTLPNSIELIDEYAFASFNSTDITIPDSLNTFKANAFRDLEKKVSVNACDSEAIRAFAPKATFDFLKTECE